MKQNETQIASAFAQIGISFKAVFPTSLSTLGLYAPHRWESRDSKGVICIYAIPSEQQIENSFIEKWSRDEKGEFSHSIYLPFEPPFAYHDIFTHEANNATDLPCELRERRWYVIEEGDQVLAWGIKQLLYIDKESRVYGY